MIAAAVVLAAVGVASGDDAAPAFPPPAAFAGPDQDATQDLIILGETRPIFLRLRVLVGDRPWRSAWAEAARVAHGHLDANGDGKLTLDEAEANGLGLLVGPAAAGNPTGRGRGEIDKDPKDGTISVDELREALGGPNGAFRLGAAEATGRRTDALFDHLDRDKDGAIARAELAASVGSLRQLDSDADEWIDGDEVAAANGTGAAAATGMGRPAPRDAGMPAVLSLGADESPLRVVRALLKKYDTGSSRGPGRPDSKLSAAEFAIPPASFARADLNADGLLNGEELRKALANHPADAVADVVLPVETTGRAAIRVRASEGGPPDGLAVRQLGDGQVEVEVGPTRVDIQLDTGLRALAGARQTLLARFNAADTSRDGYLSAAETADENGQPGPLAGLFGPLDRDHDGKLTLAEINEAVDRQVSSTRARLTMNAQDEGRSVFGLLDRDGNRRLGAREVLAAHARRGDSDRNQDGRVPPDEIQQQIHLTLGQGDLTHLLVVPGPNPVVVGSTTNLTVAAPEPTAGPPWFRKMDRNRDGDISRREFLGTHAQFDRLDRDRDGLLAPAEADAATAAATPVRGPGG